MSQQVCVYDWGLTHVALQNLLFVLITHRLIYTELHSCCPAGKKKKSSLLSLLHLNVRISAVNTIMGLKTVIVWSLSGPLIIYGLLMIHVIYQVSHFSFGFMSIVETLA